MSFLLSKDFRFESAHRLANNYQGKCSNIHGHSWNGKLTISCEKLDEYGFALDYGLMKPFLKRVEELYDHKLLLNMNDKNIIGLCERNNFAISCFSENPTSETIAKVIFDDAVLYFQNVFPNKEIKVVSVQIDETCTSSCLYTGKNNEIK